MAAVRFVSLLLLLVATIALATDLTRLYTGQSQTIWMPLARHWAEISPNSLASMRKAVSGFHPALWSWGIGLLADLPGWLTFGTAGAALGYIGRHRRRVNIYTN